MSRFSGEMLSTFPATDFVAPLPDFASDFTHWDDLSYLFESFYPSPGSGSDTSDRPAEVSSSPDNSGSDPPLPPNPVSETMEERKRKRKLSNRESARRSRLRKQKQIEDLVGEVHRLQIRNRELTNQLQLLNHHSQIARWENERLWGNCLLLRRRFTLTTQILQLHTNSMPMQ